MSRGNVEDIASDLRPRFEGSIVTAQQVFELIMWFENRIEILAQRVDERSDRELCQRQLRELKEDLLNCQRRLEERRREGSQTRLEAVFVLPAVRECRLEIRCRANSRPGPSWTHDLYSASTYLRYYKSRLTE